MPTFVHTEKCDGCKGGEVTACVYICPHDLMKLDTDRMKAFNQEPEQCWECQCCVKACPQQAIEVRSGGIPVMQNVDVEVHPGGDEIRSALARQLWQPVRWSAGVQSLVDLGVTHFAECGPGKVLTGLNRRISRDVTTASLADHAALAQTLEDWK